MTQLWMMMMIDKTFFVAVTNIVAAMTPNQLLVFYNLKKDLTQEIPFDTVIEYHQSIALHVVNQFKEADVCSCRYNQRANLIANRYETLVP